MNSLATSRLDNAAAPDTSYLQQKLGALADKAVRCIGENVAKRISGFVKAGQIGSSRCKMYVRLDIEDGFVEHLRRMARLVIDIEAHQNIDNQNFFIEAASALAVQLISSHKVALFGSPAFDRNAITKQAQGTKDFKEKLDKIAALVVEDMRRSIVGHERHQSAKFTEASNMYNSSSTTVINSPGSVVQQGRDHLQQTVQQQYDFSALKNILEEIDSKIPEFQLEDEDIAEIKAQIASIQAQLGAKRKDNPFIQRTADFVADFLKNASNPVATALGIKLSQWLLSNL